MSGQHPPNVAGTDRRTVLGLLGAGLATLGTSSGIGLAGATTQDGGEGGIPPQLPSAVEIDAENMTVTLPMFSGRGPDGETVNYVVTEASSIDAALELGLNWAPKLANALGTAAVQEVDADQFDPEDDQMQFAGTVDFSRTREVVAGPEGFPLDVEETQPGSVGDDSYSPLVAAGDEVVFNAPHVENRSGVHDALVESDEEAMTATLQLVDGFYEDRQTLYISTDAYPADVAALEGATHVPNLAAAPAAGDRDLESSAREPIFPVVNGPMGADDPERQGLRSAVAGEGDPLNVTRSEQVCADADDPTDCSLFYSPLWDVHPVVWTEEAIDAGNRRRLTDHEDIIELFLEDQLASAGMGPENTLLGNIRAADAAVNCPIITVEEEDEGEEGEEEEDEGEEGEEEEDEGEDAGDDGDGA